MKYQINFKKGENDEIIKRTFRKDEDWKIKCQT